MDIFKTATFRQSAITTTGAVINGLLGAIFYILIARFLGPSEFGLLIIAVATLTLIADIVDFGTNTGLVRHVSASLHYDEEKALKFLKLAAEFKLVIWLGVLIIGFLGSPVIAKFVFNKEALSDPLRLIMIGVGGASLLSFASSALQAYQKFFVWSIINIVINFLRLVLIIILFNFNSLNLFSGLFSYILMPFLGFSLALLFLPIGKILLVKKESVVAKQFFNYNFWVAIFTIIAAISSRLDTFLSARLLSNFEIGLYGAASQLVSVVPQLVSALGVVVAPKFSSFQNNKQMLVYFKKIQLLVLGFAAFGILTIPLAIYLIPVVFGQQYSQAVIPFIILFLAMLVFLISLPVHTSIIYYFAKPKIFVWVTFGHLLIIGILGYVLISSYGVVGAAITVLVGMVFNLFAPLSWFLMRLRKVTI